MGTGYVTFLIPVTMCTLLLSAKSSPNRRQISINRYNAPTELTSFLSLSSFGLIQQDKAVTHNGKANVMRYYFIQTDISLSILKQDIIND